MTDEADGVLIVFLSHSSWTTGDHLYTSGYTDARLRELFDTLGHPTHLYYQLGINVNTGVRAGEAELLGSGSHAEYVANLRALDARIRSQCTTDPLSCFGSTFKTSTQTQTFFDTMEAGLAALGASDSRYSHSPLYTACGGDSFAHTNFLQNETGTYLHPSSEGSRHIGGVLAKMVMESVAYYDGYLEGNATRSTRSAR